MTHVHLTLKSGNEKTGPIPVSMTERATCPDSCSFKGNGCYAEGWPMRLHWDKVAERGREWPDFCKQVAALPAGQLWRHNSAGDLPRNGEHIDREALEALVTANAGKRGFTYTHHSLSSRSNRETIANANLRGFTVNVSCDSLEAVDDLRLALPTVVVLPMLERGEAEPKVTLTPGGVRVVTCPAQYRETNCAECGLCARADRRVVIGFRAHGYARRKVTDTVRGPKRSLPVVST